METRNRPCPREIDGPDAAWPPCGSVARKCEAKLNGLPNFVTEIDGLDIHFIHVRSRHEDALPVVITHGWPGSIIEQLKLIEPLTNSTAHGGSAADAFHVVIPSLPGHGFSGKPTAPGWDPVRIARAWVVLMKRLGYTKYVAQGGDWGNAVSEQMALLRPPELLGIHTNMPATIPAEISKTLKAGGAPPAGLSADEKNAYAQLDSFYKKGLGYAQEMANRPQTLYALADSPVGLAAWMLDHDERSQQLIARVFSGQREGHARRHPRQRNVLLADEYRRLFGSSLLGKQIRLLRSEGRRHPCCSECVPGRDLCCPSQLDRAGVSKAHPFQQARQRRPLRGVGTTHAFDRGAPQFVPVAAHLMEPR